MGIFDELKRMAHPFEDEDDDFEDDGDAQPEKPENLTGLMFTAAGLLVGIAAVIIYWVVRFL